MSIDDLGALTDWIKSFLEVSKNYDTSWYISNRDLSKRDRVCYWLVIYLQKILHLLLT